LVRGAIFVYLDNEIKILSAKAGGGVALYGNGNGNGNKRVVPGLQVQVNRYARHNWGRAREYLAVNEPLCVVPRYPEDIDEEVVVEEWTEPTDISKPLFFWNLNGVVLKSTDAPLTRPQKFARWALRSWWISFQLFTIFWELDNRPVVLDLRGVLGEGMGWALPVGVHGRVKDVLSGLLWVKRGRRRRVEGCAERLATIAVLGAVRILGWVIGVRAVDRERTPVGLWEEWQKKGM
jgi:hypothetical protein